MARAKGRQGQWSAEELSVWSFFKFRPAACTPVHIYATEKACYRNDNHDCKQQSCQHTAIHFIFSFWKFTKGGVSLLYVYDVSVSMWTRSYKLRPWDTHTHTHTHTHSKVTLRAKQVSVTFHRKDADTNARRDGNVQQLNKKTIYKINRYVLLSGQHAKKQPLIAN